MVALQYRYVLDRFSSVHYFDGLVQNEKKIRFSKELFNRFQYQMERRKNSKRNSGGWVFTWLNNNLNSRLDWYPYGSCSLVNHSNFNRWLLQKENIELDQQTIFYGDNFLPWENKFRGKKSIAKQLMIWEEIKKKASSFLLEIMTEYRPELFEHLEVENGILNEAPISSMKYLEVCFEITGSQVSDAKRWFQSSSKGEIYDQVGRSQSGTVYFRPHRKSDEFSIKAYQKSFDITRVEISLFGRNLNIFKQFGGVDLLEALIFQMDNIFEQIGLRRNGYVDYVKERDYDEVLMWVCKQMSLKVQEIEFLGIWSDEKRVIESYRGNQSLIRRLKRRGLIVPIEISVNADSMDDTAPKKKVRGKFKVAPEFVRFWNLLNENSYYENLDKWK